MGYGEGCTTPPPPIGERVKGRMETDEKDLKKKKRKTEKREREKNEQMEKKGMRERMRNMYNPFIIYF